MRMEQGAPGRGFSPTDDDGTGCVRSSCDHIECRDALKSSATTRMLLEGLSSVAVVWQTGRTLSL
jgi:hypothetical protein